MLRRTGRGRVSAGTKVGIIGLGGLGSLGAQTAIAKGAEVYVTEVNEAVHEYARLLGATAVALDITAFADAQLDLVASGGLTSRTTTIGFEEIGEGITRLERGQVVGRLVAVTG